MTDQTQKPSSPQPGAKDGMRKFPIWLSLVLLATVVLIASIGYLKSFWHGGPPAVDPTEVSQDVGGSEERKLAPVIEVFTDKGQATKLSERKGKVVLLSFWASWCGPCLEELPLFAQLSQKYQGRGFEVFAVNVDEVLTEAQTFVHDFWKNKSLPFASYFDQKSTAVKAYNIEVLPANYLIDRKGYIAFTGYGASDWTSDEVEQTIEDLLTE